MSIDLTKATFEDHEGSIFSVKLGDESFVNLELINVSDHSNDKIDGFSLLFRSDPQEAIGGDIHQIQHGEVGEFEMSIHPVNESDESGHYYEAVFSRLKED